MTAIPLIVILILAFVLPGIYGKILFGIMAAAALIGACHEAFTMLRVGQKHEILASVFALILLLSTILGSGNQAINTIICLFVLCSFLVSFGEKPTAPVVNRIILANGAFLYICWSLMFMVRLYFLDMPLHMQGKGTAFDFRYILLYMVVCTKMADVGAYFIGSSTAKRIGGNHKISIISPKKSWEGLIGGTIFSVATALGLFFLSKSGCMEVVNVVFGFCSAIIFGVLASVVGLIGDLSESMLKRAADVKDSGNIPGLGGVLDILDSLIFVAPLFYAFVSCRLFGF